MADPVLELQGAIIAKLKSAPSVTALVSDRIADIPQPAWSMPYISIGASTYNDDSADCIVAGEAMIQIDCWSNATVLSEMRSVVDAVRRALRDWSPDLATNALVTLDYWRTDYINDDPIRHGAIRYNATIEEP